MVCHRVGPLQRPFLLEVTDARSAGRLVTERNVQELTFESHPCKRRRSSRQTDQRACNALTLRRLIIPPA